MTGAFRVDIYSVGNVKTNGTTSAISQVKINRRASRVGALSFVVPTLEYINAGMGSRKWYHLYHLRLGFIGRFRHLGEDFDENAETVSVACEDALASLIDVSIDFNMSSVSSAVSAELNRVLGRAGWTATLANSTGEYFDISLDYQGINIMQSLDSLRQMQRGFFALSGASSVRFGRWTDALRDSSAYTLITNAATNGTGAAISSLVVVGTSSQIVNRIIPRGQGIGTTQVDLSKSTRTSPYTIVSRANWDGGNTDGTNPNAALTRSYYIEDASSITTNGVVERVAVFSDVRPITNSLADQRNAANALYDVAAAYMQQYKNPTTEYRVSVIGTETLIAAGDVVMLDYRGVSETAQGKRSRVFIDKKRFFVVEATHDFDDVSGEPVTTLTLAENGAKLADVTDVFTNLLADLDKFKLRPAPSMCFRGEAGPTRPIKPNVSWIMALSFDSSVLEINDCKFIFEIGPLISYANNSTASSSINTTASDGASTQTSATTSSASSALTTEPIVTSMHPSMVVAGQNGWTGYARSASSAHQTVYTNYNTISNVSAASGNTGGVTAVFGPYGSFAEFQQHIHDQGGHTHVGDDHQHNIWDHFHDLGNHSHGMAHTHVVSITISIPPHTHGMAHNHVLEFGVTEDTVTLTGVEIYLNSVRITPIKRLDNHQFAGNSVSGTGAYYVDLTSALLAIDWRGTSHEVKVSCTGGRGLVHGRTRERLTIQPIRVID